MEENSLTAKYLASNSHLVVLMGGGPSRPTKAQSKLGRVLYDMFLAQWARNGPNLIVDYALAWPMSFLRGPTLPGLRNLVKGHYASFKWAELDLAFKPVNWIQTQILGPIKKWMGWG